MKQLATWLRTPRRWLPLCACAVLVAALALLPLGVFAISDRALMGTPRAGISYTPIVQTGNDFYLIRQMVARAGNSDVLPGLQVDKPDFYLAAQTARASMQPAANRREYIVNLLKKLSEEGVIPQQWLEAVMGQIGADEGFYMSSDTLGFVTFSYFPTSEREPYSVFSMTIESKTGAPVQIWLTANEEPMPQPSDVTGYLEAFVRCVGLTALGDWSAPQGTEYAQSGLYSKRGAALATCVQNTYSRALESGARHEMWYYNVQLSPLELDVA